MKVSLYNSTIQSTKSNVNEKNSQNITFGMNTNTVSRNKFRKLVFDFTTNKDVAEAQLKRIDDLKKIAKGLFYSIETNYKGTRAQVHVGNRKNPQAISRPFHFNNHNPNGDSVDSIFNFLEQPDLSKFVNEETIGQAPLNKVEMLIQEAKMVDHEKMPEWENLTFSCDGSHHTLTGFRLTEKQRRLLNYLGLKKLTPDQLKRAMDFDHRCGGSEMSQIRVFKVFVEATGDKQFSSLAPEDLLKISKAMEPKPNNSNIVKGFEWIFDHIGSGI